MHYKCPSYTLRPISCCKRETRTKSAIVLSKMTRPEHHCTVQHPRLQSDDPQATVGFSHIYAHGGEDTCISYPAMTIMASFSKKAQVLATSSKSKKSHRASRTDIENAPRRECMTLEQLKILNPFYDKNPRPTAHDIELLAQEIHR
jgi:hypothetical protein